MDKHLVENIKSEFQKHFKNDPLMVFAPGRINLIGEHTDYNNGFVLPAAIDKGIVTAIQKSEKNTSSIIAIDANERLDFSLDLVQAIENGDWKNYVLGIVGELQNAGKHIENFNLVFGGNIPKGAGLSSSAALENSVVFALNALFDLGLTKTEMIFISQKAEHNYVGVKCGIMDQYASMLGQDNTAILLDCQNLKATDVILDLKAYSLLLINTNVNHQLSESAYNHRRRTCEKIAAHLKIESLRDATESNLNTIKHELSSDDYQIALYVIQENQRVLDAYKAIDQNNLVQLGNLLLQSHQGLQQQYKVSCDELDFLVDKANHFPEVLGTRMMGGGFGGCTINLVKTIFIPTLKTLISNDYSATFNRKCAFYQVTLSNGTQKISF